MRNLLRRGGLLPSPLPDTPHPEDMLLSCNSFPRVGAMGPTHPPPKKKGEKFYIEQWGALQGVVMVEGDIWSVSISSYGSPQLPWGRGEGNVGSFRGWGTPGEPSQNPVDLPPERVLLGWGHLENAHRHLWDPLLTWGSFWVGGASAEPLQTLVRSPSLGVLFGVRGTWGIILNHYGPSTLMGFFLACRALGGLLLGGTEGILWGPWSPFCGGGHLGNSHRLLWDLPTPHRVLSGEEQSLFRGAPSKVCVTGEAYGCSTFGMPPAPSSSFFRGGKGNPTGVLRLFCPPSGLPGVELEQYHPLDLVRRGLVGHILAAGRSVVAAESTDSGY